MISPNRNPSVKNTSRSSVPTNPSKKMTRSQIFTPQPRMLRQFALGWALFFIAWGAYQFWGRSQASLAGALVLLAILGPVSAWFAPRFFRSIYIACALIAFPLGWVISHIALAIMFYGVVFPMAVAFRLSGRDRLQLNRTTLRTYWKQKNTPTDPSRYLRIY